VTVLTDRAMRPEEINVNAAREVLETSVTLCADHQRSKRKHLKEAARARGSTKGGSDSG